MLNVAIGLASNLFKPIGLPVTSQYPYVLFSIRFKASSILFISFLSLSLVRSSIDFVLSAEAISAKSPDTSLSSYKFKIVSFDPFRSLSFHSISFCLK